MMWKDPIVEELERYREAHAQQFNYDARAIYEDMKAKCRQHELEGWRVVSRVPVKKLEKEEQRPV
jgi:hypothetical protein